MEKLCDKLTGALIGLVRVTDGNEHFITAELTALVSACLAACYPENQANPERLRILLTQCMEMKRAMVPNCFVCDHPCGRTSDYDMEMLVETKQSVREMKLRLLHLLQEKMANGNGIDPEVMYDGLYLIGMDMDDTQYLMPVLSKLEK